MEQEAQVEIGTLQPATRFERYAKVMGKIAGLGVLATSGVVIGAIHDPVEARLGPHRIEATATFDSQQTVDFGPFDSLDKPADFPFGAGVDLTVKGNVKDDIYMEDYARFLSNPSNDIRALQNGFREQALKHAGLTTAAALGGYLLLGKRRREEHWNNLEKFHASKLVAVLIIGSTVAFATTSSAGSDYSTPVSDVFDGTVLEGARAKGPIMNKLVNEFAPEVLELLEDNNDFYNKVVENLETATYKKYILRSNETLQTALFYTDNHCNLGMARAIGVLEKASGSELIFDGGDTTMGGTEFEAQCFAVIADATQAPVVFAAGNHDGKITEDQAKRKGFRVLNGELKQVNGITVLGDNDPRRSEFAQEIALNGNEDEAAMSKRLAEVACDSKNQVDVLLVHDASTARESLENGCVDLALSGHTHKYSVEEHESGSVQIVGGTAGGKSGGGSTFGPLRANAELYLLQFDRSNGSYIRHQQITIHKDANVTIGEASFAGPQS